MLLYATSDDYTAWTGAPGPDSIDQLLRSASLLVGRATRSAHYKTTPAGLPVDTDLVEALRDATCAQAAMWAALDVDPTAGPAGAAKGSVQSSTIGGASVTRSDPAQTVLATMAATTTLSDQARWVLDTAGLLTGVVHAW